VRAWRHAKICDWCLIAGRAEHAYSGCACTGLARRTGTADVAWFAGIHRVLSRAAFAVIGGNTTRRKSVQAGTTNAVVGAVPAATAANIVGATHA
jgi:hypothetical protein